MAHLTAERFTEIWDEAQTLVVTDFQLDEIIAPHILEERILRGRIFASRMNDLITEVRKALQGTQKLLKNRQKMFNSKRDHMLVNDPALRLLKPVSVIEATINTQLAEEVDAIHDLELELADLKILFQDLTERRGELTTTGSNFRTAKDSMIQRMQLEGPSKHAPVYTAVGLGLTNSEKPVIKPQPKKPIIVADDDDLDDDIVVAVTLKTAEPEPEPQPKPEPEPVSKNGITLADDDLIDDDDFGVPAISAAHEKKSEPTFENSEPTPVYTGREDSALDDDFSDDVVPATQTLEIDDVPPWDTTDLLDLDDALAGI
jgi:hypothetical protein